MSTPSVVMKSALWRAAPLAVLVHVLAAAVGGPSGVSVAEPRVDPTAGSYLLTVTNPGPGVGTIVSSPAGLSCSTSCRGWFPVGSTVSLTATAETGSQFLRWFGDCEGSAGCTVVMDGPRTVVGSFKVSGDPYAVIHHFMPGGHDGAQPSSGQLVSDGSALYGITRLGGRANGGVVFRFALGDGNFQILHEFVGGPDDGLSPSGSLTIVGGSLCGVTASGGASDQGVVFCLGLDGKGFRLLHAFAGYPTDGAWPNSALALQGSVMFGTTYLGGLKGVGTVFRIDSDGSGYEILRSFGSVTTRSYFPTGALTLDAGVLYGTTQDSIEGWGTLFRINTDGSGFQFFEVFRYESGYPPSGPLVVAGGTVYGTLNRGPGTIFKVQTDGTGYGILRSFPSSGEDGEGAYGGLSLCGDELVGLASRGGVNDQGTVFKLKRDGSQFTVLHSFSGGAADGASPWGLPMLSNGKLVGMTSGGGPTNSGTVFELNPDGSGFRLLRTFEGTSNDARWGLGSLTVEGGVLFGVSANDGSAGHGYVFRLNPDGSGYAVLRSFQGGTQDGSEPQGSLTITEGVLFGTTYVGGEQDKGTVFRMDSDGSRYEIVHHFRGSPTDGNVPYGPVIHDRGVLYGTTRGGGTGDQSGVVFKVNADGTGHTILWDFGSGGGWDPWAPLTLHDNVLFGITPASGGGGTVFRLNTDGTGFDNIHFFGLSGDGKSPRSSLTIEGGRLYGTTLKGGTKGLGTVFSMGLQGAEHRVLHSFTGTTDDGSSPQGSVRLVDGALYGTTQSGGASGLGVVFKIGTDGSGFQVIQSFRGGSGDGRNPEGSLVELGGTLYGMTGLGGVGGSGVVFSLRNELTVAGQVVFEGTGLAGVTMLGLPGNPVTDATGRYSVVVPLGWSGTVTPSHARFAFSPSQRAYASLRIDQNGQDFEGVPDEPRARRRLRRSM